MKPFYLKVYSLLPKFLKRRINPLDFMIKAFVHSARPAEGRGVILDAGAGEASFQNYFFNHVYVALDSCIGDKEWDYSKIHLCADLSKIPLAANSVDVAINTQVLEHVSHPEEVLKELYRVLKTQGKLYLTAPQGWHEHQKPHDYFRYTQYSLRILLKSAGFRDIVIEPLGGYFYYLGNRLTYIPKVLFQDLSGLTRCIFFPLELLTLLAFCLLGPVICYYLDPLDRKNEFTLSYKCLAVK